MIKTSNYLRIAYYVLFIAQSALHLTGSYSQTPRVVYDMLCIEGFVWCLTAPQQHQATLPEVQSVQDASAQPQSESAAIS